MAAVDSSDLQDVCVTEREVWEHGVPHELFARMRQECPVHWTAGIREFPEEAGYWSVTTAEDVHAGAWYATMSALADPAFGQYWSSA